MFLGVYLKNPYLRSLTEYAQFSFFYHGSTLFCPFITYFYNPRNTQYISITYLYNCTYIGFHFIHLFVSWALNWALRHNLCTVQNQLSLNISDSWWWIYRASRNKEHHTPGELLHNKAVTDRVFSLYYISSKYKLISKTIISVRFPLVIFSTTSDLPGLSSKIRPVAAFALTNLQRIC